MPRSGARPARPARKAVVPVNGRDTRLLPATKAAPKELLPVVDRPALQYVVDEAARAGLDDVLMVSGRGKSAIEDYFDRQPELEQALEKKGDADRLASVRASEVARVHFVRQGESRGLGHAVLQAATFVGDEVVRITGLVEKAPADEAPSTLAVIGRYVLAPEVFDVLRGTRPGWGDEIQLTDALATLVERGEPVHGVLFSGRRYDTGDRLDYLTSVVRLAVERDDLGPPLRTWLRNFVADLPAEGASPS